jgi:hypothetical protein
MAPLGALSLAWVSAEAALPRGWRVAGLWRVADRWVALSEGPGWDDYLGGRASTPTRRRGGWPTACASGGDR